MSEWMNRYIYDPEYLSVYQYLCACAHLCICSRFPCCSLNRKYGDKPTWLNGLMTDGCCNPPGHYHLLPSADRTLMLPQLSPQYQHMTHMLSMPGWRELMYKQILKPYFLPTLICELPLSCGRVRGKHILVRLVNVRIQSRAWEWKGKYTM